MDPKGVKILLSAYKCSYACALSPNLIRIIQTRRSERPHQKSQDICSISLQSVASLKADESNFSVPGLFPLKFRSLDIYTRKQEKNSEAHLKISSSSVWGFQCPEQSC